MHGAVFAALNVVLASVEQVPEFLSEAYFYVVLAPALILSAPFTPLLWRLHLMHTPGWFAWPKAEGFALVYICWVLALLIASVIVRSLKR